MLGSVAPVNSATINPSSTMSNTSASKMSAAKIKQPKSSECPPKTPVTKKDSSNASLEVLSISATTSKSRKVHSAGPASKTKDDILAAQCRPCDTTGKKISAKSLKVEDVDALDIKKTNIKDPVKRGKKTAQSGAASSTAVSNNSSSANIAASPAEVFSVAHTSRSELLQRLVDPDSAGHIDDLKKKCRNLCHRIERISKYEHKPPEELNSDQKEVLAELPMLKNHLGHLEDVVKFLIEAENKRALAAKAAAAQKEEEQKTLHMQEINGLKEENDKILLCVLKLVGALLDLDHKDPTVQLLLRGHILSSMPEKPKQKGKKKSANDSIANMGLASGQKNDKKSATRRLKGAPNSDGQTSGVANTPPLSEDERVIMRARSLALSVLAKSTEPVAGPAIVLPNGVALTYADVHERLIASPLKIEDQRAAKLKSERLALQETEKMAKQPAASVHSQLSTPAAMMCLDSAVTGNLKDNNGRSRRGSIGYGIPVAPGNKTVTKLCFMTNEDFLSVSSDVPKDVANNNSRVNAAFSGEQKINKIPARTVATDVRGKGESAQRGINAEVSLPQNAASLVGKDLQNAQSQPKLHQPQQNSNQQGKLSNQFTLTRNNNSHQPQPPKQLLEQRPRKTENSSSHRPGPVHQDSEIRRDVVHHENIASDLAHGSIGNQRKEGGVMAPGRAGIQRKGNYADDGQRGAGTAMPTMSQASSAVKDGLLQRTGNVISGGRRLQGDYGNNRYHRSQHHGHEGQYQGRVSQGDDEGQRPAANSQSGSAVAPQAQPQLISRQQQERQQSTTARAPSAVQASSFSTGNANNARGQNNTQWKQQSRQQQNNPTLRYEGQGVQN